MNAFFHWFGKLHRRVYALNGAVGRRFAWVPCLVLTTTGRKSGARRDSVLVYADDRDGGGRVVVASNGGSDHQPGWLFNVRADPAVRVQVGKDRYDATARVVSADDTDFARLWLLVNSINGNRYDAYQSMTGRSIALVVLDPTTASIA